MFAPINADFPSVLEYEIPAYINDTQAISNATGKAYFTPALTASNAVYAIWIGTNDLGDNAFLTDSQVAGKTITDFTDCVFVALDRLYASGGRYFVLNNIAPLYLAPLYANDTDMGVTQTQFWQDKPANHTAIAEQMKEYSTLVNKVWKYQVPYEALVANRYPGANFAIFDVYSLVRVFILAPSLPQLTDLCQDPRHLHSPDHLPQWQRTGQCNRLLASVQRERHHVRHGPVAG